MGGAHARAARRHRLDDRPAHHVRRLRRPRPPPGQRPARARGLEHGDRVGILARTPSSTRSCTSRPAGPGSSTQPLNWRLSPPRAGQDRRRRRARRPFITRGWLRASTDELQRRVDVVDHWLQYGPDGDGSYEALLAAASDDEPEWSSSSATATRSSSSTPAARPASRRVRCTAIGACTFGMLNQTVAERIVPTDVYMLTGQMYHIPVVLSMNYMRHGCPLVLMNFEATLALELIEAEHVSAFLGITTMLNWMMAVQNFSGYDISSLRNIQYGGGPMPSQRGQGRRSTPSRAPSSRATARPRARRCASSPRRTTCAPSAGIHPERLRSCGREGFVTSVRVVDEDGRPVPTDGADAGPDRRALRGQHARLLEPPRPHRAQTLRDGWMWTGDVATWDARALRVHRRPGQGHDHLGWREHLLGPGRGGGQPAPRGARVRRHRRSRRGVGRVRQGVRRAQAGHHRHRGRRSSRPPRPTWRRTRSPARSSSSPSCPRRPRARSSSATLRDPYWADHERNV